MQRVAIGPLSDLPDGRVIGVEIAGRRLAVVRIGERVFAMDDRCSHRGFPLHDGTLEGTTIRCRTHGACFALDSGEVVRGPARRAVRTYPVSVEAGTVLVEL
jgi:3-phenylpropionate/trans-cinnamate dioxygenase ferredoxin component